MTTGLCNDISFLMTHLKNQFGADLDLSELRLATFDDASELRLLLNRAYAELAEKGWNYTASYQDDLETQKQIEERRVFLLQWEGRLIATVSVQDENWFSSLKSLYIGKFAVEPSLKRSGIGKNLMSYLENLARTEKYESLQLDTAKPAIHLVEWYQRLGFRIIGETQFEGKTYESWIFEKVI